MPLKVALSNKAEPLKVAQRNLAEPLKVAPLNLAAPLKVASTNQAWPLKVAPLNSGDAAERRPDEVGVGHYAVLEVEVDESGAGEIEADVRPET